MSMKMLSRLSVWRGVGLCIILGLSSLSVFAKPFPESEVNPLLSTNLQILTRQASGIRPQGDSPGTIDPDEEITVILEPSSGNAARISDSAIHMAGGVVEARSESLIRVRVSIDKLESLADDVAGIVYIREPLRPVPLAVVSQGVALTGASDFHGAGYEGQGVKVAIIDLGFEGLSSAQAAGELQNVVFTHDYTENGLETEYVHGTGVAEIVEDMAPQAQLYLMKIGDSVDLQNAVQDCIDNGVHIINHSVGWYNSNYYDGTGIIGAIASNARANDILWVNSAGNEAADGHWQGAFVDTDTDGYHEFAVGSDYLDGDSYDEGNRIYANGGDTVVIYMSWDDWTASDQDYDLYLYNSAGTQVASSTSYQNGFQSPTEAIFYDVVLNGYYEIVIQAYDAPQEPEIEFFAFLDSGANTGLEHHDPTSTIMAPANSADVLAVGAIRRTYWTTGPQESFSSQGPSNASIHASSRIKPDVAGSDGTSSYTYGSFYGTSASSPHVAGAAALLLSEDFSRTADVLQMVLEFSAIDMGTAGKDNIYGSGRLELGIPVNFAMENGTVVVGSTWETVTFTGTYVDPVVVAKPASDEDADPVVVRIRNVTAGGFEIRLQEWDYQNDVHGEETVGYLVVERGSWTLPDSTRLKADSFNTSVTNAFTNVGFGTSFNVTPVVVASVVTYNDAAAVCTRIRDVGWTGFRAGLEEEEAANQVHGTEEIAYVAWEPGSGSIDSQTYEVGTTGNVVTHNPHLINLAFGASIQVWVEEETSHDDEIRHATEDVGYFAFSGSPSVFIADMQTVDGGDPSVLRYNLVSDVSASTMLSHSLPASYARIDSVLCYPNPLRESDTAITFRALGNGIAQVEVTVYDLSGKLLFTSRWVEGDTVEWIGVTSNGMQLANGVYIFRILAMGDDGVIDTSQLGKTFILR